MNGETIFNLLFPPKCPFCQKVLERPGICPACLANLPFAAGQSGVRSLASGLSKCVFALDYDGVVRQSLLQFKFGGHASWAMVYADLMATCIAEHLSGEFDCITWVPVSRKRLRRRGYDQSRLLAEACGKLWESKPIALLCKTRNNQPQSSLEDSAQRRSNVANAYEALPGVSGRRILLIDDIVTTGSTLSECCRTLHEAGAVSVVCGVLAGHT